MINNKKETVPEVLIQEQSKDSIITTIGTTEIKTDKNGITIRCGTLKIPKELIENAKIETTNTNTLNCSGIKITDLKTAVNDIAVGGKNIDYNSNFNGK